ncbi:MAG: DUF3052 domain-containing protein [SAR202 cluster bacterium]|nr:DUF3052 domain-containing protein [SAR202 cluster bacterium]
MRDSGATTAGYSGTPLAKKLGIKAGMTIVLLNAPEGYDETLAPLPDGVTVTGEAQPGSPFIQVFTTSAGELAHEFPRLREMLARDGMLWVSWPKGSSRVMTDLTEKVVRDIGLSCGLVDVKVCAVDRVWSGLKFVRRLKDRGEL